MLNNDHQPEPHNHPKPGNGTNFTPPKLISRSPIAVRYMPANERGANIIADAVAKRWIQACSSDEWLRMEGDLKWVSPQDDRFNARSILFSGGREVIRNAICNRYGTQQTLVLEGMPPDYQEEGKVTLVVSCAVIDHQVREYPRKILNFQLTIGSFPADLVRECDRRGDGPQNISQASAELSSRELELVERRRKLELTFANQIGSRNFIKAEAQLALGLDEQLFRNLVVSRLLIDLVGKGHVAHRTIAKDLIGLSALAPENRIPICTNELLCASAAVLRDRILTDSHNLSIATLTTAINVHTCFDLSRSDECLDISSRACRASLERFIRGDLGSLELARAIHAKFNLPASESLSACLDQAVTKICKDLSAIDFHRNSDENVAQPNRLYSRMPRCVRRLDVARQFIHTLEEMGAEAQAQFQFALYEQLRAAFDGIDRYPEGMASYLDKTFRKVRTTEGFIANLRVLQDRAEYSATVTSFLRQRTHDVLSGKVTPEPEQLIVLATFCRGPEKTALLERLVGFRDRNPQAIENVIGVVSRGSKVGTAESLIGVEAQRFIIGQMFGRISSGDEFGYNERKRRFGDILSEAERQQALIKVLNNLELNWERLSKSLNALAGTPVPQALFSDDVVRDALAARYRRFIEQGELASLLELEVISGVSVDVSKLKNPRQLMVQSCAQVLAPFIRYETGWGMKVFVNETTLKRLPPLYQLLRRAGNSGTLAALDANNRRQFKKIYSGASYPKPAELKEGKKIFLVGLKYIPKRYFLSILFD